MLNNPLKNMEWETLKSKFRRAVSVFIQFFLLIGDWKFKKYQRRNFKSLPLEIQIQKFYNELITTSEIAMDMLEYDKKI